MEFSVNLKYWRFGYKFLNTRNVLKEAHYLKRKEEGGRAGGWVGNREGGRTEGREGGRK